MVQKAERMYRWYLAGDHGTLMLHGMTLSGKRKQARVLYVGLGRKDTILVHTKKTVYGCSLMDARFSKFDQTGERAVPGLSIYGLMPGRTINLPPGFHF
ncbi:hypothetical protein [Lacrimispora sp. 210928-DFI.3.58]|uniref:hypothetical protein n=1 Tax=Lacrimispora sp. 210928-DFI.3.58 TaxID=2883214 RepID=UPI001D0949A1|nr:hypothetical protein [Lacrimispora sp. 210928-DFI.3.58]MCB7319901.1 hypothetical protein [Lacrimispora sp. 210928-DFI.3.58]